MPAHRSINQHKKRDRLPSEAVLQTAQELIQEWWQRAYLQDSALLPQRFVDEARASLPGLREPVEVKVAGKDVLVPFGFSGSDYGMTSRCQSGLDKKIKNSVLSER